MKSLVIIPTYNEIENIKKIVISVLDKKDNFDVLIVDDSSPDGTSKVVEDIKNDYSHDPDDLPRLLYTCSKHGADACVGSRYVPGGKIINWPKSRYWLSYYASLYVRFVLNINIKDTTAGFICYKREVLEKINLDNIWFIGYAFQIEMKYSAIKHGFNVKEIPIHFKDRELGQSKMNIKIFREAFIGVLKLKSKKFEA